MQQIVQIQITALNALCHTEGRNVLSVQCPHIRCLQLLLQVQVEAEGDKDPVLATCQKLDHLPNSGQEETWQSALGSEGSVTTN